jgi:urease accessory protein
VLVPAAADALPAHSDHLAPGSGLIDVEGRDGVSRILRVRAASPLKLLAPRNHGVAAWIYQSSYGGGLVDGDAVSLRVRIGVGARAMIATQSWTKVYRSPGAASRGATVTLDATVADRAHLLLLPDPVVPFADAKFEATQRVDLEEGANLVLVDWLTAGRRAAGERWRFSRYHSRLTVRRSGRVIFLDRTLLSPSHGPLPDRLGRFNVLCLAVVTGPALEAAVRRALGMETQPAARRSTILHAVWPLPDGGAVVRLAGESFEPVAASVRHLLDFVPAILGDDPWARKW